MDLIVLASSRAPFAVMLGVTVLLTVFAFRLHDRLRWLYLVLSLAVAGVVLAKNFSYEGLVSGVEGSLDAHHAYAGALFWVVVSLVALGVILLLTALATKRLTWLSVLTALCCGYAALAMTGWRLAYLGDKSDVQYVVWQPALHWVALVAIAVTLAVTIGSLARSRRRSTATP